MSDTKTRGKFQAGTPIKSRPEDRIAAQTAQRRAQAAANRPKRFTRPSRLTAVIMFFGIVGFGIAVYTLVVHYVGPSALVCAGGGAAHESSCEQVQFSIYNNVAGIPVSMLGVIGYAVILISLRFDNEYGRALGFGSALIGFLFSMYLTFREGHTLHEWCEWCLTSAFCMTVLMVLLGVRFFRASTTVGTPTVAVAGLGDALDDDDLDDLGDD